MLLYTTSQRFRHKGWTCTSTSSLAVITQTKRPAKILKAYFFLAASMTLPTLSVMALLRREKRTPQTNPTAPAMMATMM